MPTPKQVLLFLAVAVSLTLPASAATCVAPPSGALAWWSANYTTSDQAGTNHASFVGSAGYGAGLAGAGFALNGVGGTYLSAPDSSSWAFGSNNFSIELWANFAATNGGRVFLASDQGGGVQNKWVFWLDSGVLRFHINGTPGSANIGDYSFAPVTNQWYHLAVTRQSSNYTFYVNGAPVSTNVDTRVVPDAAVPLTIGQAENNFYFSGRLDEIAIYNVALGAATIQGIYAAGSAGKCAPVPVSVSVPYFTDFEAGIGAEWSGSPTWETSERTFFTRFLGRYSNQGQLLSLTNLTPGQSYLLEFDFYPIDSWDGNSGSPDFFNVAVDGGQLFHHSFANYNGNPPSATQTFPGSPDEGRANYGFNSSFVDAIYRGVSVTFAPSNTTALILFSGQGLQDISDESWGIDNVRIRAVADVAGPTIHSTTLPPQGTTLSEAMDGFVISATIPLAPATAGLAANYSLRESGTDGVLGNVDDSVIAVTPAFTSGRSVSFTFGASPLQPGRYRFQTGAGLQATNGAGIAVFTRDFFVANPLVGRIENTANDSLATASIFNVTETPAGSGFLTAFGEGSLSSGTDVDYWRFEAEAGDLITVRVEAELTGVYPQLQIRNGADGNLGSYGGSYEGVAGVQNFSITTPGSYYLRIYNGTSQPSRYQVRLDQARLLQLEGESNDAQANANNLALTFGPGIYQGRAAGALPGEDTAGDLFRLGNLNTGNSISVNLQFPNGSALVAGQMTLSVELSGNTTALITNSGASLNFSVPSNGVYFVRIASTNRTLRSQYYLNVAVSDGVPPVITSASFPAEGQATGAVVDRFSLGFAEDMLAASVTNLANYELRGAGSDSLFNTADDQIYNVLPNSYVSSLSANYSITDGPLQPGLFRFTARTGLVDRANNNMAASYIRNFSVTNLPGYSLETRGNEVGGTATALAPASGLADGTFSYLFGIGVGSNPEGIASGFFNSDTNLDLVTANLSSDNITVLTNAGRGIFAVATNIPTGDGALEFAVGYFNSDSNLDLAVANYYAGTVTILLGNGAAGFTVVTNLTGCSGPWKLASADLNADGIQDLVVPNYTASSIRVFLGVGNGTFLAGTNYTCGSGPAAAALKDLNGDSVLDVAVPNHNSASVSVLFGNGTGGFLTATNYSAGNDPRDIALVDVSGDGVADLVSMHYGDSTVGVFLGNTNGTFQTRSDYPSLSGDPYSMAVADVNGDSRLDLVLMGYGSSTFSVLLNSGGASFTNAYLYSIGGNPIDGVVADFTGDGRLDLAFVAYNSAAAYVYSGNNFANLSQSPLNSGMRSAFGRGNLSNADDVDYFRFSGTAGDRVMLAVEVPGAPGSSGLQYRIERYDGINLNSFFSDFSGYGQSSPLVLPYTGTYLVRVTANYDFQSEYRFRVTTVRPPTILETEANNTVAQANALSFTLTNAHQVASVGAFLNIADSGGDYCSLGNLADGTTVTLSLARPDFSGLGAQLSVHNSDGTTVAISPAGATNFVFTVGAGQGGAYYARVMAAPGGYTPATETVLRFDASDDYVDLGNWFNLQTFSISMWINPASSQNGFADIMDNNHNSSRSWVLQYQNTGSLFTWGVNDGSGGIPVTFTPNVWQQLTVTRDAANVNRAYLNGVLIGTAAGTGEIFYDGTQFLRLGRWGGGGRYFNGSIDELRIWNRELTAGEVAAGLTGSLTGNEPGLIGYWPFNDGIGTNAVDLSSSNRVAGLLNGVAWQSVNGLGAQGVGLASAYLLNVDLADNQPPFVVSTTLPAASSTVSNLITQFGVTFNEDIDAAVNGINRTFRTFNTHTYFLTDSTLTWPNAEAQAVAAGGHLVTINNAAENTWVNQNFSSAGILWIGLNDIATEGTYVWASGESFSYTNWNSGEPNNSGNEDGISMIASGRWNDAPVTTLYRALVEVSSTLDSDLDGLIDLVDAFPTDAFNGFDLRAAGLDGQFDTADDQRYRLSLATYTSGTNLSFALLDGPLQPGNYRFTVTTGVKDRSGNAMATPFIRNFTVSGVAGFAMENRTNNSAFQASTVSTSTSTNADGSLAYFANYGTGNAPHGIQSGHFDLDGHLDMAVMNYSASTISIMGGNGDGTFRLLTNLPAPTGPIAAVAGQFWGDTNVDLVVANYGSSTVTIWSGNGQGQFQSVTNFAVGGNPYWIATADFNGDGLPDFATPNNSGHSVSVILSTNGTYAVRPAISTGQNAASLAVGDVNGDGSQDIVVACYGPDFIQLLLGNGDGTFQAPVNIASVPDSRAVTLGYMNGDTILDLVAFGDGDNTLRVLMGNGDGTFQTASNYVTSFSGAYQIALGDLNGDGWQDVVLPVYGSSRLVTLLNRGDGTLAGQLSYQPGSNPIRVVVDDVNHDSRKDVVAALYSGDSMYVLLGNDTERLGESLADSGIREGYARGSLSDANDVDYWSFFARTGDILSVAVEVPGNPGSSGLCYYLEGPERSLTSFCSTFNGWDESSPVTIPADGTYTVRVQPNYNFFGEYRIRVTLVRPPTQVETENNSSTGSANSLNFAFSPGHQKASVFGYNSVGDTSGDYFRLGNLAVGTTINLGLREGTNSTINSILQVYNAAGTMVSNAPAGTTNLVFPVPAGGDGAYFARVVAASGTFGLLSTYILDIDLADTQPPFITSLNLPAEGAITTNILDRFTLGFSEDLTATTVTNAANYDFRAAGPDNVFNTVDDVLYRVANSPVYASGLSASYLVTDGPLQPGLYRFTVRSNLADRAGLNLTNDYVRNFSVVNLAGYVLESRTNNSTTLATTLSTNTLSAADGSFLAPFNTTLQNNPYYMAVGRLNGDTNLDLVVANYGSGTFSVLLGNGNGSFQVITNQAVGAGPVPVVLGYFNSDSNLDLAVGNYNGASVSILLGDGTGRFQSVSNYSVGTSPHCLVSGDFNQDGKLDLVSANVGGSGTLSVLLGNGDGSFNAPVSYTIGGQPAFVAKGDIDGDGDLDLVTANQTGDNLTVLLGAGTGTFAPGGVLAANNTPRSLVLSDLDNDGDLDIAVCSADNTMQVIFGNGNGTFQQRVSYASGTSDCYEIIAVDLNGDGWKDLAVAGYSSDAVTIFLGSGAGNFQPAAPYRSLANNPVGVVAGDFNNDGRMDLVTSAYSGGYVTTLLGNPTEVLAAESGDGRFSLGLARGVLTTSSDADFYSFSAVAGQRALFAAETVGAPGSSGLHYSVYRPDGAYGGATIADFYGDFNGRGDATALLPYSGRYTLRVENNYTYPGEYRVRVLLVPGELQVEAENNDNVGQANSLTFSESSGHQRASVVGYIAGNDGAGDYFRLGNLGAGAVVNLDYTKTSNSTLAGRLWVYNSAGTALTNSGLGGTNLTFVVTNTDSYYARITADSGAGLMAIYQLNLDTADTTAPSVTSISLPANNSTNIGIYDRFSLTVSKDLDPAFNALTREIKTNFGRAYYLSTASTSWRGVEAEAMQVGGHLVTINTAVENDWLAATFPGSYWIGLNDEAIEGTFTWISGEGFSYTNWSSGEPNGGRSENYGTFLASGKWADASSNRRGIIEVSGLDTDGDGTPDALDAYPNDAYNLFDLRSAGVDGLFDTVDDDVYRIVPAAYTSGLSVSFSIVDGPLQAGSYRFRVTGSLRDRFGNNSSSSADRFFTIGSVPGYILENRDNNSVATATPLPFVEDPTGLKIIGARGNLTSSSDNDLWSFEGAAGDTIILATEIPGFPGASQLYYRIYNPAVAQLTDFYPAYTGEGQTAPIVLTTNGTFYVQVTYNYSYFSEYRMKLFRVPALSQIETEVNNSIATANPLNLNISGESRYGSIAGYIRIGSDLDYYNLGTITNGSSIFLSARLPGLSSFSPVVSVYNAANVYQSEASGGRNDDSVAEVRVTTTGTYYAIIRSSSIGDIDQDYILDAQVVPTGSVSFPNLQVTSIGLPSGGSIQSGQPITFTFTVENVGSLATPSAGWIDRAVMSLNTILGDGDDIPLGFLPHNGALASGANYTVTNTVTLPEGISGDYYIIVQADSGNAVNEFLLEADNTTVSPSPFTVNLAPYANLVVENLSVTGPDANSVYTVTWDTANRGTAAAPGGFRERFFVRNQTSGSILANVEEVLSNSIPVNATVPRTRTVTATNAGTYLVQVTTDSQDQVYEFAGGGHAVAEQNTASGGFQITQFFNVSVAANPPAAGAVTGGGSFVSGSVVNVNVTPNTNVLPYFFINWTEGGLFQSSSTNYSFVVSRDRTLVANFGLPNFQVSASNNPPAAGTVAGQGFFVYNTTNNLTATANAGYRFTNWTQNGVVVGLSNVLTTVVLSNRSVVANYVEANTFHVVATATSPTNVALVTGSGVFNNGQSTNITAPLAVTNSGNIYTFREFRLNGAPAGASASFNKIFTTQDPTNMQFVAFYDVTSIKPVVVAASAVITNTALGGYTAAGSVIPAITNLQLVFRFDRVMNPAVVPQVLITNALAGAPQPLVTNVGTWFTTAVPNDSYRTPFIAFTTGMDGTNRVTLSAAADTNGVTMNATNAISLVVDVTPPLHPILSLTSSNDTSATFSWSAYAAPADLGGFRVYLSTNDFASVTGLSQVVGLSSSSRAYAYSGLMLDTPYYAAVAAVDLAGNSALAVTTRPFVLPRSVPPPASITVNALDFDSAQVVWSGYSTAGLLGFAGFNLYYETSNFTSVAGLTVRQTVGAGIRSARVDGLDRTKTYYFAIVGFNSTNGFNPAVTTKTWSDPYAGNIGSSLTFGGAGQVIDILQTITVLSNATLTIQPGTTVRFAPGAGLMVQQGRLVANGSALNPIVFTSINDPSNSPVAGSWNGLTLSTNAGTSILRHVFVHYGAGLTVDACSPVVEAFTAQFNIPAGLGLLNGAILNSVDALLVGNGVGAQQSGPSQLTIRNSVIKNNGTNALAASATTLIATQVWWGTSVGPDIDATVQGPVNRASFLGSEPLLTPAIGTLGDISQTGVRDLVLRLACRTAESMRLSEDSAFTAVFFSPFSNSAPFQISDGGGQKVIYAQFRSITGQTSAPVSVTVAYITAGPTFPNFSLTEGQLLTRPIVVTGSATAPLGMAAMEFYLDNVLQVSQPGGALNYLFDVRSIPNGIHRVKLVARDTANKFSVSERNVVITPNPPPAPVITSPLADLVVSSNTLNVAGTAEPLINVRLSRNGAIVGATTAGTNGAFSFASVSLVEGDNALLVSAYDDLGSADSAGRSVVRDSGPPSAVVMEAPFYTPANGLSIGWHFADTGERPASFVLFWHTNSFSATNGLLGAVNTSSNTLYRFTGLPAGNYFFRVVGFDLAGNPSALSDSAFFSLDPNPPSFTIGFDKSSPVGVGPLGITIISSEALSQTPTLALSANGTAPVALTLSNSALNTYQATLNVTPSTPSGPVTFTIGGRDVAGNTFNGAPSGPALSIDVQPPSGRISTIPGAPVQTTNNVDVAVSLILTETPKAATAPVLSFNPPVGSSINVVLSGTGTNWNGTLPLTPAMGSGFGTFSLSVTDALNNVGHLITSGTALEIYNSAFPNPPGQPVNFQADALSGGRVRLSWNAVSNAEIYRLYREPGTNFLPKPAVLVADGIASNSFIDLPATNGFYRFVVSASRRGSEGTSSITRVEFSDRTPPPAPTNVAVALAPSGVQITWLAGVGETPARYNIYRNGTLIRTVNTVTPVTDYPPRGVIAYTVGAADALGNEALSESASIELLVGAVNQLVARVVDGGAPLLTWVNTDGTAVGYNVYRNGVKQNASVIPSGSPNFTDLLGVPPGDVVSYAVRAVNATNAESSARVIEVRDVALGLRENFSGTADNALVNRWFDKYRASVSNRTASAALPLDHIEFLRTIPVEGTQSRTATAQTSVGAGNWYDADIIFPGATNSIQTQTMRVRAFEVTDLGGSSTIYEQTFTNELVLPAGVMMEVTSGQQPLAGGLATLNLTVFNKGYADMDLLLIRNNGADVGDLYLTVKNTVGQELSRLEVKATVPGMLFTADGRGFVRVVPGGSINLTVSGLLVPEALGTNTALFEAVFPKIYYRLGSAGEVAGGPITGSMSSSLAVTPYYGLAQTDKALYADDDVVHITGQAIDRQSGLPKPNAPLKIGFYTRGYRFYYNVTSDIAGNFAYDYTPPPGLSGTLKIWAAHPDVFDTLNQAEIKIYRMYLSPNNAEIRMTKNDRLPFTLRLINPGDEIMDGFTLDSVVYRLQGTNRIPDTNVVARFTGNAGFVLNPRETKTVPFELSAHLNSPDNVLVTMTLRSSQGAGAKFEGNVSLLPANPLLVVIDPPISYVDVGVNRGQLLSKTVTIVNRGLRELKGVTLDAPTNVSWFSVNLPTGEDGKIHLADMPVGLSNSFTVVFSPPTNAPLEYHQDKVVIRGTNSPAVFDVNLYALVTSSQKGDVQFFVDNILVQPVPNATVRIKNTLLQQEFTAKTDANGYVTVTNLQEGPWAWQVNASGHSAQSGVIDVVANQTVLVDTRLSRALVTVNFSVVPVPFTDRYEIIVEQTFETHVPAPVLVATPAYMQFHDLTSPFEATYIVTVKNEGLIQMTDVQIGSGHANIARLSPLINYFPLLRAQESVEVPMKFVFDESGNFGNSGGGGGGLVSSPAKSAAKSLGPQIDENGNITQSNIQWPENYNNPNAGGNGCTGGIFDLDNFFGALNAIIEACAQCIDKKTLLAISKGLQVGFDKAKDKGKFDYWKVIEAVVKVYELLGCPGSGGGSFGGGSGGGNGGGGGGPGTFSQYGGGGAACFVAGTGVLMADGSIKPIERVSIGDRVRTGANAAEVATVSEVLSREVAELIEIETGASRRALALDGAAKGRTLRASTEHMFWVDGRGWVAAQNLESGDWLLDAADERVPIQLVRRIKQSARVHTFSNREDHAFFAEGLLVRDSCGDKTAYFKPEDRKAEQGAARIRATIIPAAEVRQ